MRARESVKGFRKRSPPTSPPRKERGREYALPPPRPCRTQHFGEATGYLPEAASCRFCVRMTCESSWSRAAHATGERLYVKILAYSRRMVGRGGRRFAGGWFARALALAVGMVQIGSGRLAKDVPLANRVRSGRKQP